VYLSRNRQKRETNMEPKSSRVVPQIKRRGQNSVFNVGDQADHKRQGKSVSASHSGDLHYISQSAVKAFKGASGVALTNTL
jgi:hypothetical protein